LQILSLNQSNKTETGRYYSKIMLDVVKAENLANTIFNNVFGAVFSVVYAIVVLSFVDSKLMLWFFLVVPVYVMIYRLFSGRFRKYQHQARKADEDLSQAVNQFIQTSLLTRVHGEEAFEARKIDDKGLTVIQQYKKISGSIGAFGISIATISQVFQITIVSFSAIMVMKGSLTIGGLILFLNYMQQIVGSVNMVMDLFPTFTEASESIRSIREILDSPDIEQNESKPVLKNIKGRIEFENVMFSYTGERQALEDINLVIEPGTTVALVGPSGSGKSTLVNMALGMLRPQQGICRVDGNDINNIDMRSVRRFVGVVTQQPILFYGTVAENIAHARIDTPRNQIEDAAKKANAHEFIMAMDKGYDTIIGEQGTTLSGGQRQRIAIARAILRKPSILILDEATSALDSLAEREVQTGIDAMLGRQTTLTIAHRLSTVRKADLIIVLNNGKIVETGTHASLLKQNGMYVQLHNAQTFLVL
jgi:ATP-binding cassette subfamily B protein